MNKSILTSTIAKLELPIGNENDARRECAFNDICNTLEMCYREQYKLILSKQAGKASEVVRLIDSLKEEIKLKLKEIATSDDVGKRETLTHVLDTYIVNKRENIKNSDECYTETERYSKSKVRADLGEMLLTIRGFSNLQIHELDEQTEEAGGIEFYKMQPPTLENSIYPDSAMGNGNPKGGDER